MQRTPSNATDSVAMVTCAGSIRISGGLATEDFSRRLIRPDYRLSAHPSRDTPEILMLP